MAIVSRGYEGSVDYADWAELASQMGAQYTVDGESAFDVWAADTPYGVLVQPGRAAGAGILDESDSPVTLVGTPVTSGSRWDLVALRRNWATKSSQLVLIPGAGGATPSIPTTRSTTPGIEDDQPLALVRFIAGATTLVDVAGIRVWHGDGGMVAESPLVRDYLTRLGTRLWIAGVEWTRGQDASGTPTWFSSALGSMARVTPGTPRLGSSPAGPFMQMAGTRVAVLNGASVMTVPFPAPFPNFLLAAVATPSDASTELKQVVVTGETLNGFQVQCLGQTGGSLAGKQVRVNWIAMGG